MKVEDYNLSGLYVRVYLSGIRKLTGPQYGRLLEQVGLRRFSQKYPPSTTDPVLKAGELIPLSQLVRETIGDELYRLFLRNQGRAAAEGALKAFEPSHPLRQFGAARTALDLYNLLQMYAETSNAVITGEFLTVEIAPEEEGVVFCYHGCLTCAISTGLSDPECISAIAYYKQLLYGLTQRRFQVTETHCALVKGGNDCYFLIK